MSDLPVGWTYPTVADLSTSLVDGPFGSNLKSEHYSNSGVRVIRLQNIADGSFNDDDKAFIPLDRFPRLARHEARPGDVLIAAMGDLLPRVCLVPSHLGQAVVKADCFRLRPATAVGAKYLAYALSSPQVRREAMPMVAGIGRPRLNLGKVASLHVPLAPAEEQVRIVASIEELFTRLTSGMAALQSARRRLAAIRRAVLEAAATGHLVDRNDREDVGKTLSTLATERQVMWNRQTTKPYRPPAAPARFPLGIPEHWRLASLEELTDPIRVICYGILMPKENIADGVPYVRVKDMRGWSIELDGLKRTSPAIANKYARASLVAGDLLLSIRGSYGRVALVPDQLHDGNITQDTARIAAHPKIDRRYLLYYLGGSVAGRYYNRVARGVAVRGVNIGDLRSMPVPVPPRAEQVAIADEVERQFTVIDSLETALGDQVQSVPMLRSTVLRAAFSGSLVAQEMGDETSNVVVDTTSANHASGKGRARSRASKSDMNDGRYGS